MDILDDEILQLWRLLHKYEVEYLMVGGFAVTFYGHRHLTPQFEMWIKDTLENRKKIRIVLEELLRLDFEAIETMQFIPGWSSIHLSSGFELDIMTYMSGFSQERFDDSFQYATVATVHDIPVRFLHFNQLIEAKKAAGRPKDLLDIEALEKLRSK